MSIWAYVLYQEKNMYLDAAVEMKSNSPLQDKEINLTTVQSTTMYTDWRFCAITIWWQVPWNRGTIIAWYMDDRWVRLIAFVLSFLVSFFGAKYYLDNQKKTKIANLKGGVDFTKCLEPNKVYEVIDKGFQQAIRTMLGNFTGLIVVDVSIAIMSSFLLSEARFQIPHLGVTVAIESVRNTLMNIGYQLLSGGVVGAGMAVFTISVLGLPVVSAFILASSVAYGATSLTSVYLDKSQCANLIKEVPVVQIALKDQKQFEVPILDIIDSKDPTKVFINGTVDIQQTIYTRKQKLSNCETTKVSNSLVRSKNPDLSKQPSIHQKCKVENPYIPLSKRTKTLRDLKKYDDTDLSQKDEDSIESYNSNVERLKAQRLRIREDRNVNNEF